MGMENVQWKKIACGIEGWRANLEVKQYNQLGGEELFVVVERLKKLWGFRLNWFSEEKKLRKEIRNDEETHVWQALGWREFHLELDTHVYLQYPKKNKCLC